MKAWHYLIQFFESKTTRRIEELEVKCDDLSTANITLERRVDQLEGLLGGRNLSNYNQRPKLKKIKNFDSLLECYMLPHSDRGYKKLRDGFLLDIARRGYRGEVPSFTLKNEKSKIELYFTEATTDGCPVLNGKTRQTIDSFPKFEILYYKGERRLFGKGEPPNSFVMYVPDALIQAWVEYLRQDLPYLLKNYMLGYALACMEKAENSPDAIYYQDMAVRIMNLHGLESSSLPDVIVQAIGDDDNDVVAGLIETHCLEKKETPKPNIIYLSERLNPKRR